MKKTLVSLVLALVLVLGCAAVAMAVTPDVEGPQSMHWENQEDFEASWLVGQTIVIDKNTSVEVVKVEIHKEPTCTEAAQWKLYYYDLTGTNKLFFVIGYFYNGKTRAHMGHVWASDAEFDGGIVSITKDPATQIYTVTYKNGMTTTLHGDWVIEEPTCTSVGKTYDFCVYCGEVNKKNTRVIPRLDHSYVEVLAKEPKCITPFTNDGTDVVFDVKDAYTYYECKYCSTTWKKDGKTETHEALRWVNKANIGWRLVSATGKDFTDAYVALGYEKLSGHKFDGWAPNKEYECIKQRHCMICEQTEDQKLAPDWVNTGMWKNINCYLGQQPIVCARCNGKTPGHEARIAFYYAGNEDEMKDDWDGNTSGIPANTEGVYGAWCNADLYWKIKDLVDQGEYANVSERIVFLNRGQEAGETKESHAWHMPAAVDHYILKDGTTEVWGKQYDVTADGWNFCVDPYWSVAYCQKCGTEVVTKHGPDGHTMSAWEVNYLPGSGDNVEGEWIRKCTKCGIAEKYHGTTAPAADYWEHVQDSKNGLQYIGGQWAVYVDGERQYGLYDLYPYNGHWFLLQDGALYTAYTGLYSYDTGWFFIDAGQVRDDLNGFVNTTEGFMYFAAGQLQEVTTLVQYDGAWFYIVNGKLATDYTGPVVYDGATFNVVGGQVQF